MNNNNNNENKKQQPETHKLPLAQFVRDAMCMNANDCCVWCLVLAYANGDKFAAWLATRELRENADRNIVDLFYFISTKFTRVEAKSLKYR